jgi:hypothetical protein
MTMMAAQERDMLAQFDARRCARIAAGLAKTQQVQAPTLVLPYHEARHAHDPLTRDPRWHWLRADEQARWLRLLALHHADEDALAERRWQVARRIVHAFHRAGVRILAGTDAPMPRVYPGWSLHEELELLVRAGLTPAQALHAATLAPAQFLDMHREIGSIATGKRADLLLLDADPTQDIRNTRRIRTVVLAGRVLTRVQLKELLHRRIDHDHRRMPLRRDSLSGRG